MPPKRKVRDPTKANPLKRQRNSEELEDVETKHVKHSKTVNGSDCGKNGGPTAFSHWLVKSEPNSRIEKGVDMKFSFDDLKACKNQTSCWDGVRNYQARNFLRDQLKVGHDVFFYHSNCKEPGIVGLCRVVSESYPDHTAFDRKDPHFDGGSTKENPRWYMVDVQYTRPLKRFISLAELKRLHFEHAKIGGPLKNLALFTKARLSVQPISTEEWEFILKLEESDKS